MLVNVHIKCIAWSLKYTWCSGSTCIMMCLMPLFIDLYHLFWYLYLTASCRIISCILIYKCTFCFPGLFNIIKLKNIMTPTFVYPFNPWLRELQHYPFYFLTCCLIFPWPYFHAFFTTEIGLAFPMPLPCFILVFFLYCIFEHSILYLFWHVEIKDPVHFQIVESHV